MKFRRVKLNLDDFLCGAVNLVNEESREGRTKGLELVQSFITSVGPDLLCTNLIRFKPLDMFGTVRPDNAYTLLTIYGIIVDKSIAYRFDFPIEPYHYAVMGEINLEDFALSERSIKRAFIDCEIERLGIFLNEKIYDTITWSLDSMSLKVMNQIWQLPGQTIEIQNDSEA